MTLADEEVARTTAAARSRLYALFARALSHPGDDVLAEFESGCFEDEVLALMSEAGYSLQLSHGALFSPATILPARDDIKTAYASAFEAGLPKVSLREANYVTEGEKPLFEDLFRFYDHFGLDTSSGTLKEWPDHVAVELEFMHYLTWLEEGGENKQALRRAQRDFLARHLGAWTAELAKRLEDKAITPPYPGLAKLLATFIAEDHKWLTGL